MVTIPKEAAMSGNLNKITSAWLQQCCHQWYRLESTRGGDDFGQFGTHTEFGHLEQRKIIAEIPNTNRKSLALQFSLNSSSAYYESPIDLLSRLHLRLECTLFRLPIFHKLRGRDGDKRSMVELDCKRWTDYVKCEAICDGYTQLDRLINLHKSARNCAFYHTHHTMEIREYHWSQLFLLIMKNHFGARRMRLWIEWHCND